MDENGRLTRELDPSSAIMGIAGEPRKESDSLGETWIPAGALWGAHTQRAMQNFPISGYPISKHPAFIAGYMMVKQACAWANHETGEINREQSDAITETTGAVSHVIETKTPVDLRPGLRLTAADVLSQFPVDVYQGGAGTSTNMNVNEVIANLSNILLGRPLGKHDAVMHPNDVVNRSQSTNDTYPTAAKITLLREAEATVSIAGDLSGALKAWADQHATDAKLGRTQLQDAVPMSYKQEATAWARHIDTAVKAIEACSPVLRVTTLGGTAIGTGLLAGRRFGELATARLADLVGEPLVLDDDLVAGTTDVNSFMQLSGALKQLAVALKKLADDLRLLASGPRAGLYDYKLPALQAGSSIMPGKVNPVIPEMMDQVTFRVMGADATVQAAAGGTQLQLCAFEPIMLHELLRSMELLQTAMSVMRTRCVMGLEITDDGSKHADEAISDVTGLVEVLGYDKCAELAHKAADDDSLLVEVIRGDAGLAGRGDVDKLIAAVSPWALINTDDERDA